MIEIDEGEKNMETQAFTLKTWSEAVVVAFKKGDNFGVLKSKDAKHDKHRKSY